jgi:hypothetical protein
MNVMNLIMDPVLGGDMETCLHNLKNVLENRPVSQAD